jgi:D-3-phosphoglycerate dehydrogenase
VLAQSPGARDPGVPVDRVDVDTLFAAADFVFLCCPLTEATRHLVSAPRLRLMKPSAFLINVARGGLVDTAALVAALDAGRLAGAALDVFDPEPLAPGHPLLGRDDVILSAHVAGGSVESNIAVGRGALAQLAQILADTRPTHIVNPDAWAASRPRRLAVLAGLAAAGR